MLLALFALAALPSWTPARWNSADPKSLALLAGTPINCILLESSSWNPDFLKAAASNHIATLAVLHAGADIAEQARRAADLKMNGVVLEGDYASETADQVRSALSNSGLAVIELPIRRHMRLDSRDPILGTSQGLWPGIEVEHGGAVMTGPTSNPWIDTNTGFLRFVRAATDATLWVGVRPRPKTAYTAQRYEVAIADAAMSGARWIVSLDDDLERRLLDGEPKALEVWKQIASYLDYYRDRPDWRGYRPFSHFAIVQDTESGGLLSASLLDMLTVQHTSVRPILTRRLSAESLHGARIVLNVDAVSIGDQQKRALADFAAEGGTVVNPPPGWTFPKTSDEQMSPNRRQMNQIQGLWEVTYTATARKNFGARTFNTASVLYNLLASPDNKSLLIQLVNYADFAAETVAVQVQGKWSKARLYRPDGSVQELQVYPVRDGTGMDIDKFTVAATLRVDQ